MKRLLTMGLLALTALAVGACGDVPTAVEPPAPSFDATTTRTLKAVRRSQWLNSDLSWTQVIGPSGGRIGFAGLELVVPEGALDADVPITVTLPAGSVLQVQFGPHGLRFERPVRVKLTAALVKGTGLAAAYFTGDFSPEGTPALEVLTASKPSPGAVRFDLWHFSGYVIVTGFEGEAGDYVVVQ
ncbi:MAG: hypothetical protein HY561_08445 [Gemmatimonadetes bacterium]|nr:hypothetical protein [Gemmatimonadota bacterium]